MAIGIASGNCFSWWGVFSTRLITHPILTLNEAVKDIAQGQWRRLDHYDRADELGELAKAVDRHGPAVTIFLLKPWRPRKMPLRDFLPPHYLKFLGKTSVTQIELGDHITADMAVMFSDTFVSSPPWPKKCSPRKFLTWSMPNLQRMSPEIRSHRGFVVKFIGDGMMSVFPKRVENAIAAGIAQFEQMRQYNTERRVSGEVSIRHWHCHSLWPSHGGHDW